MITNEQILKRLEAIEKKIDSLKTDVWLTQSQICDRLNISPSTLYRYREKGKIGRDYKIIGSQSYRYHLGNFSKLFEK